VNIVPTISGHLNRSPVSVLENEHLKHIVGSVDLADTLPKENEPSSIEMLVGNDFYLDLVLGQRIELYPGLFLLGSKLGWILTGRTVVVEYSSAKTTVGNTENVNDEICQIIPSRNDSDVNNAPDIDDVWQSELCCGVLNKPKHTTKSPNTNPSDSLKWKPQIFHSQSEVLQNPCNKHSENGPTVSTSSSLQCRNKTRKAHPTDTKLSKGEIEPD